MSCPTADFVVSRLQDIVFFLFFPSSLENLTLVIEVIVGQVVSAWEEAYVLSLDGTKLGFHIINSLYIRGIAFRIYGWVTIMFRRKWKLCGHCWIYMLQFYMLQFFK